MRLTRARRLSVAFAAAILLVFALPAVGDVDNGGFESPDVTDLAGWDIFTSSEIGDWTVEWAGVYTGAPDDAFLELHAGVNGWVPNSGDQYAELDTDWQGPGGPSGEQASVSLNQNVQTLENGNYTLEYAWSPRPNHNDNAIDVLVDGIVETSHSGSGGSNTDWTESSLDFDAAAASTEIAFRETGTPDSLGMFLDDVCVTCNYLEYDLIAGQHYDVGSVLVWDDGDNIYVKYQVDDPWKIEEIHLAVGATADDIPANKGGPIPGQFPIKDYFDPWVTMAPTSGAYVIPFDEVLGGPVTSGDGVVVAAHAVVWDTSSTDTVTFYSYTDVAGFGRFGTYGAALTATTPTAPVTVIAANPAWTTSINGDADWITILNGADPAVNQWARFEETFEVPGPVVGPGTIWANSDNAEKVVGATKTSGTNGDISGTIEPEDRGAFKFDSTYTFTPVEGENTVQFIVRNYEPVDVNNPGENPMALIYKGEVDYFDRSETAWGSDGACSFDGRNWALCLEYTIGDCDGDSIASDIE